MKTKANKAWLLPDIPAHDLVFHIFISRIIIASKCDISPQSLKIFILVAEFGKPSSHTLLYTSRNGSVLKTWPPLLHSGMCITGNTHSQTRKQEQTTPNFHLTAWLAWIKRADFFFIYQLVSIDLKRSLKGIVFLLERGSFITYHSLWFIHF